MGRPAFSRGPATSSVSQGSHSRELCRPSRQCLNFPPPSVPALQKESRQSQSPFPQSCVSLSLCAACEHPQIPHSPALGYRGPILGCGLHSCSVAQRMCPEEGAASLKAGDTLPPTRLTDGSDVSGSTGNSGIQMKSISIALGLNWLLYNMPSAIQATKYAFDIIPRGLLLVKIMREDHIY